VAVYFVDTSALAKRYVSELGSAWLRAAVDPAAAAEVFIVRITAVELIAALSRRARAGALTPADAATARTAFRLDLSAEYQVVELTQHLAERAMALAETHGLRRYDAVQLAAALEVNVVRVARGLPPLTLLSSDAELNAAGVTEGLVVEDPGAHP
jgi:predicted nucleic acid-binding protein